MSPLVPPAIQLLTRRSHSDATGATLRENPQGRLGPSRPTAPAPSCPEASLFPYPTILGRDLCTPTPRSPPPPTPAPCRPHSAAALALTLSTVSLSTFSQFRELAAGVRLSPDTQRQLPRAGPPDSVRGSPQHQPQQVVQEDWPSKELRGYLTSVTPTHKDPAGRSDSPGMRQEVSHGSAPVTHQLPGCTASPSCRHRPCRQAVLQPRALKGHQLKPLIPE